MQPARRQRRSLHVTEGARLHQCQTQSRGRAPESSASRENPPPLPAAYGRRTADAAQPARWRVVSCASRCHRRSSTRSVCSNSRATASRANSSPPLAPPARRCIRSLRSRGHLRHKPPIRLRRRRSSTRYRPRDRGRGTPEPLRQETPAAPPARRPTLMGRSPRAGTEGEMHEFTEVAAVQRRPCQLPMAAAREIPPPLARSRRRHRRADGGVHPGACSARPRDRLDGIHADGAG